jgi:hypothetical protein
MYSLDKKKRKKIINRNSRKPSKEELIDLKSFNFKEIAKKLNMSQSKIRYYYKLYGIEKGNLTENEIKFKSCLIDFKIYNKKESCDFKNNSKNLILINIEKKEEIKIEKKINDIFSFNNIVLPGVKEIIENSKRFNLLHFNPFVFN